MSTRALLLDRSLELTLGRRDLRQPGAGEALVRVEFAGVCGSDLHVLRSGAWVSYWPATLGHEVSGVVEACPGGELAPGTPVVADSRVPCGRCAGCARAANLCESLAWLGEVVPGGFAEHLVLPVGSLVVHPPELDPAIAVLAEPLAVAMHAVSRAAGVLGSSPGAQPGALAPGERALVLGYGPIGALVHAELSRRYPQLEVSVRDPLAERRLLATAFAARDGDESPGSGFDLVVDAAGSARSLAEAVAATSHGGCVVVVALGHEPVEVLPAELAERSLALVGCSGFAGELPEAVGVLAGDPDRFLPLVSETVLLEEAPQRLADLRRHPAAGKLLVRP